MFKPILLASLAAIAFAQDPAIEDLSPDQPLDTRTQLDLAAAILYLIFDWITTLLPSLLFWLSINNRVSQWTGTYNIVYKAAWYLFWVGNLVLYAIPAVVGGFTWLWDRALVQMYVAWSHYIVLLAGTGLQGIYLIMFILGAALYDESNPVDAGDTQAAAWVNVATFLVPTVGIYVGYWLLQPNFLNYYTIGQVVNEVDKQGDSYAFLKF